MISLADRLFNFKKNELTSVLYASLLYFCILCGYFFLRPVREAMGISGGMGQLRWLFIITSLVSLGLVLIFSGIVSKLNRSKFIPIAYSFVIFCLICFAGLLFYDANSGGGFIGSSVETIFARNIGYVFFVWLSVINLFVNSLFWAFMVDIFNVDQGKRIFAFIGIGGTLGAIVGAWSTDILSSMSASPYLPVFLMLIGALFFSLSIIIMKRLDKLNKDSSYSNVNNDHKTNNPIGGKFSDGFYAVFSSPYLLGIAVYIILMAVSNTMIYFTVAQGVLDNNDTFSQRVEGFAQFDMLAQIATLFTQVFITTRIIKKIGVGWTLSILPLVTMAGFVVLAIWPVYGLIAIFQALHRATRYAISRPARETLFSVISPSEKYKAKPLIDVFLYRGGDVAGAGIDGMLRSLGASLTWVASATVPLAIVWCFLSISLGNVQKKKNTKQ
jgi:AAA family ATP:ADP antiporter